MNIPLVDLRAQYYSHKSDIDRAISNVIDETAFIRGKYVDNFEKEFAETLGVKHCVGCANGTDAIFVVLKMLGIGPGDEVIVPAHTWIATSETVSLVGASVVFADCESEYFTIDPEDVERKITARTKAIIPVHLYGQCADMNRLMAFAVEHDLFLIEDCAQSHLAKYEGQTAGTMGIAGTFSFYPAKNLGAYGDAGAIVTNDDELAETCRAFINHGSLKKHEYLTEGANSRLDGLQASILSAKLQYLPEWNRKRATLARYYSRKLAHIKEITTPMIRRDSSHIFHVYCILAERRDALLNTLNLWGVGASLHYPELLPFTKPYASREYQMGDFPQAAAYQKKILSLPMYPELRTDEIDYIVGIVDRFYA